MFRRNDVVEILKEFQDPGDSSFTWVVLNDEEMGRVDISPVDINLIIKPTYTLRTEQIKHVDLSSIVQGTR
ncbi:MAG: hypothetical protein Q8Q75_17700 [Rhodoferax sp.]|uniref:hypothetical protein n=1 Tax=Rhodoferax sp. TaxID=50421 RepID=UPI002735D470|nr:hypothetical protein [Rhodoferax sp.]MDP3866533.1 hypothetical protein [Rhodoferax sp.]